MMIMMRRVMCVLAVVLCCACGYTMAGGGQLNTEKNYDMYVSSWEGFPGKDPKPENADIRNSGGIPEGENQLHEQRHESLGGHGSGLEEIKHQETLHEKGDMITVSSSDHPPQISPNHDSDGHQNSLTPDSTLELPKPKEAPQIHVAAEKKESAPVSAPAKGKALPSGASETLTTTSTTTALTTPRDIDSTQTSSPAESAKPTDMSNVNDSITAQQPSPAAESAVPSDVNSGNEFNAAPGTSPTADSQENGNADSPTTNINSEAPTTTLSPLTDPPISKIAPTMQMKGNVDSSSVSPVWMRTAAPLLMVALLVSATVY
ncbi:uncharacterized protein TM35_001271030 [Trypanosoma theileri]|uniref:Mucin-associated surface protein (MASP) n=1 Tax=Trypanosoma theileri TaxID=67003 RepID=A0A1X0NF30_9TRYP|nr:uncharacterized protein TM35_001271030 [Trypanosoma theileri]ORC81197.1 hypothetical protein TM35_001271030 [Trypanosoma theileri]